MDPLRWRESVLLVGRHLQLEKPTTATDTSVMLQYRTAQPIPWRDRPSGMLPSLTPPFHLRHPSDRSSSTPSSYPDPIWGGTHLVSPSHSDARIRFRETNQKKNDLFFSPLSRIRVVVRDPRRRFIFRSLSNAQHRFVLWNSRTSHSPSLLRAGACPFRENHSSSLG